MLIWAGVSLSVSLPPVPKTKPILQLSFRQFTRFVSLGSVGVVGFGCIVFQNSPMKSFNHFIVGHSHFALDYAT
jgi:hypothetical protein